MAACVGICLSSGRFIRNSVVPLTANPDVRAEGIDLDAVVVTLLHHAFELEELLPRLRTHRFSGPVCPDRVNRQRARVWGADATTNYHGCASRARVRRTAV